MEASTATEMGLPASSEARVLQLEMSTKLVILKGPELVLQVCLTALYGYSSSWTIPLALTYLKALSMRPPLQAWLPKLPEQSTSCCSEKLSRFPLALLRPSRAPVAENAQHDPHDPWFLTGVTYPCLDQSMSPSLRSSMELMLLASGFTMRPRYCWANSSWVRWENWLMPIS